MTRYILKVTAGNRDPRLDAADVDSQRVFEDELLARLTAAAQDYGLNVTWEVDDA